MTPLELLTEAVGSLPEGTTIPRGRPHMDAFGVTSVYWTRFGDTYIHVTSNFELDAVLDGKDPNIISAFTYVLNYIGAYLPVRDVNL